VFDNRASILENATTRVRVNELIGRGWQAMKRAAVFIRRCE
jgi:hypothetical protein